MEQKNIEIYLIQNADKFPSHKFMMIKEALEQLDDSKFIIIYSLALKDTSKLLLISALVGFFAIDRFILGDIGLGILKLLTCGGCYIWWIIDIINSKQMTQEYNYKKLKNTLALQGIQIY